MTDREEERVPEFLDGWPFWAVFAFMYMVGFLRGQGTYWLARWATSASLAGGERDSRRARMAAWLDSPGVDHGAGVLRRFGLVAVPLCYLTVGVQTAVLLAAGVLRINAVAFTLAQLPGVAAWATIYSTIGWALWGAAVLAVAGSPWGIVAIVLLLIALLALVVALRRRRRRRAVTAESAVS
ncbi:MAG: hypothetical protein Q4G43_13210 [Mobilicoccus sp.]|nr:hypothetical protein [Mobilicoccus sp.]